MAGSGHDSALKHATGRALYVDDLPTPADVLHLALGQSSEAHAELLALDLRAVAAAPGVVRVLTAADIPGRNDYSTIAGDDPVFADRVVEYVGQPLFAVAATSFQAAARAVALAKVEYRALPAATTIEAARISGLHHEPVQKMARGDVDAALAGAPHRLAGRIRIGGQDHFYLEGQVALALPQEDGVLVHSSCQAPSEVQHVVARVLGVPYHDVTVETRRMGGGFGGKESQPSLLAAVAALCAVKTGRPAKLRLNRDDDMVITGKRHDFVIDYDVGFDDQGMIEGLRFRQASRCGYSLDLSSSINDRAMFHADNCYYLPAVEIVSERLKTHTVSNTAFRGFGGPQGMMGIERVIEAIARHLGRDPLDIRIGNLYGGPGRDLTPYHQRVEDNIAPALIKALAVRGEYAARRQRVADFNAQSPVIKKGLALTPVKFGISFTATHLNQAGALVHVYSDGSIHLNHGGTEMGQGLNSKVRLVVAREFGVDAGRVKITATTTGKVPNTSPTAASSGTDLNGMAAQAAARTIKARLAAFAAERHGGAADDVRFADGAVHVGNQVLPFDDVVKAAYFARVSLSATGFYQTPDIHYDRAQHRGRPFYYFAYGAAISEVAVDSLTGEYKLLAVDILHDVGASLDPAIDLGQIEGGFIQGLGWLTAEQLVYSDAGRLLTHAPSTYKIPTAGDRPDRFTITLWDGANPMPTIHRSKAVGEPPLMLAISAFAALGDAVAWFGGGRLLPALDAPATPEAVLSAIVDMKARS